MQIKKIFLRFIAFAMLLAACAPMTSSENSEFSNEAILNGKTISKRSSKAAKSLVIVELVAADNLVITKCSGVLIGPQTVLTAAHCFDPHVIDGLVARFIIHFENEYRVTSAPTIRNGYARMTHPNYNAVLTNPRLYEYDIAVLNFLGPMPAGFAPVKIETDTTADHGGKTVTILGYGRSVDYTGDKIKDSSVGGPVLRQGTMIADIGYSTSRAQYHLTSTASNQWVCSGDSGGAQFIEKDGEPLLIGVNSTATGPRFPNGTQSCIGRSTAAKVSEFAAWILKTKERLSQDSLTQRNL